MEGNYEHDDSSRLRESYEERLSRQFAEEVDWNGLGSYIAEHHYQELTLTAGDHEGTPEVELIMVAVWHFLGLQEDIQAELIERWGQES